MGLMLRRTLAATADALLIALLLIPLFLVVAAPLWIVGYAERHTAYALTLFAGFLFALFSSFSIGWLPTLSKRLAGIHVVDDAGKMPKKWRLLLRLLLFFTSPAAFLYGSHLAGKVASLSDPNARDLLLAVSVFTMYLATFFLPASIVATRGAAGLHDRIVGLHVESHHAQPMPNIPIRVIAGRAFIISTVASILVTSVFISGWIASGVSPATLEASAKKDPYFALLDRLLPVDKYPCRSFVIASYSRKVWANLQCGSNNGESTEKHGVFNGPYEGKVLGLAYEIDAETIPLSLVTINRRDERVIPPGTPIFTAYLYLDSIAYHNAEISRPLALSVIDRLVRDRIDTQFPVVRIKLIRFVSVGFVTLGAVDELVLYGGKLWRNSAKIGTPGILKFGVFYPPPRTYITELDVR